MILTSTERALLSAISLQLGVDSDDLYKLINFESKWNPAAKNPLSSARGLIQFTDKTSAELGFKDSSDLVAKNPTITDQLPIVKRYLERYRPFRNKKELYLSVFYPGARKLDMLYEFPDNVKNVNPGIVHIADYVNKVEGVVGNSLAAVALMVAGFFLSTII
jgi:hypothetical protein